MANFDFEYTCPYIDDAKDNSIEHVGDIVLEVIGDIETKYDIEVDHHDKKDLKDTYKSRFFDLSSEYFEAIRSINGDMRSTAEERISNLLEQIEELKNKIDEKENRISELTDEVEELRYRVSELEER